MKICPSCKINVGEYYEYCPLCQNGLEMGNENDKNIYNKSNPYYPTLLKKKVLSMFHRIQMFIMITLCILFLATDYMFGLNMGIHWSFIITVWVLGAEFIISPLFRRRCTALYLATDIAVVFVLASFITVKYVGGMFILTDYVIPAVIMTLLIFCFVFCLVDKKGNALVFAICSIVAGIIPVTIMLIMYRKAPIMWEICLIVSLITLTALIVFKGAKVLTEMQKRLNI